MLQHMSEFPSSFKLNNIPLYYKPHFVYPSICQQTLGLFPPFGIVNYATINMGSTHICSSPCFQLFWVYTRSGIVGSYGNFIFKILRNCHTLFQSNCSFAFLPLVYKGSSFSTSFPSHICVCVCVCTLIVVILVGVR